MKQQPLVSIIIPTYNRAHLIGETLDSVLAQTYTNWECIIVDDGSTDNTDEVVGAYVAKDPRFKYYHRPPEHLPGGNGARNFGFKMSQGEYVNWFDSDDLMHKNFLKNHLKLAYPNGIQLSICKLGMFKEDKEKLFFITKIVTLERNFIKNYLIGKANISTPVLLFEKKSISKIDLFDETIFRCQEMDFLFRFYINIRPKIKILDEILVYSRSHEESITGHYYKNNNLAIKSELKVRKQNLKYALSQEWDDESIQQCISLYLEPLYRACGNLSFFSVIKEIKKVPVKSKTNVRNWVIWETKFFFWFLIFKLTKREHRFFRHFNKLYLKQTWFLLSLLVTI